MLFPVQTINHQRKELLMKWMDNSRCQALTITNNIICKMVPMEMISSKECMPETLNVT